MAKMLSSTSELLSAQTGRSARLMWIYVLGERTGKAIKIGHTDKPRVIDRRRGVDREQMSDEEYVLLAAMRSSTIGEKAAQRYFHECRQPRGRHEEYFDPDDSLIKWVLWLRQQWFVSFFETDRQEDACEVHPDEWVPKTSRRESRPPLDPNKLVQDIQLTGPLAGTAWDWMPDLLFSFQDYFTDPPIVAAAANAMGGIDLDAASHWIANKRLHSAGVNVGEYYHPNKSAFTHDWLEKTWLNPPYGENDAWFKRAVAMMDAGCTKQLCMLSPVYAFTTHIAKEIMRRSDAALLFSPTPEFLNPGDPTRTGTNLPHAVIYWGDRRDEFLDSFSKFGIPFMVAWSDVANLAEAAA